MASGDRQIPGWPLLTIRLTPDGGASVDEAAVVVPPGIEARAAALSRAAETAVRIGRPVRTRLIEPDGTEWLIAVHPDAGSTVLQAPPAARSRKRRSRTKAEARPAAAPRAQRQPAAGSQVHRPPDAAPQIEQPPESPQPSAPVQAPVSTARPRSSAQERMAAAVERGEWAEALVPCEECLREAPEDDIDRLRGIQAGLTARSGDAETAYLLFRALAQERADRYGPDDPQARTAADAAQEQWAALPAKDAADLLELRSRVPGPGGEGLTRARKLVVRSRLC
ncbi:hypothetical protein [Streptomyces nodosus]|uniref:hypothetical protein n=1 Tax=Streptomyces nodosus TaxID=40318 RepID=UPI00380F2F8B